MSDPDRPIFSEIVRTRTLTQLNAMGSLGLVRRFRDVPDDVAPRQRPQRVPLPGDLGLLLHRHRQAVEREHRLAPARIAGLGCPRLIQRLLIEGLGERVEHGLDGFGPFGYCRDQFHR